MEVSLEGACREDITQGAFGFFSKNSLYSWGVVVHVRAFRFIFLVSLLSLLFSCFCFKAERHLSLDRDYRSFVYFCILWSRVDESLKVERKVSSTLCSK